jgi:hypothetical protein
VLSRRGDLGDRDRDRRMHEETRKIYLPGDAHRAQNKHEENAP